MIKFTLLFCTIWAVVAIVLIAMAISRAIFEVNLPESWESRRGELFGARLFVAFFWWLMLLSPPGRKMIFGLWQRGQAIDYEE